VIRARGTRVTLDSLVTAFSAGSTAEEISQRFPSVVLADIYQIIAHYLNHTRQIDGYLAQRKIEAKKFEVEIETRLDPSGLRARLLTRRKTAQPT
jgi:uncharacterized protein (DUF433 family)